MSPFDRLTTADKAGLLVVGTVILLLIVGGAVFLAGRQPPAAAVPATPTPTVTPVVVVDIAPTDTPTPLVVTATPTRVVVTVSPTPVVVTATPPNAPGVITATPAPAPAQPGQPAAPDGSPPPIVVAPTVPAPPTEPAQPGQSAQPTSPVPVTVEVRNATSYVDPGGVTHLIGEVFNTSAAPARPVTVTATLYDAANASIGTTSVQAAPLPIAPGNRAAFDIALQNPPANLSRFGLAASAQASVEPIRGGLQPVNPASTVDQAAGTVRVTGQIQNSSGEVRRNVVVVAVFYDSGGRVLRVGAARTNPPDIQPGATAPFEIAVPATGVQLQRFDLLIGAQ